MTFFIVHRWEETPQGDWYPWLAQQLTKLGHEVFIPAMPDTDHPKIGPWVEALKKSVDQHARQLGTDVHFIGHSIGCQTILRFIAQLPEDKKVRHNKHNTPWFTHKPLEPESEPITKP